MRSRTLAHLSDLHLGLSPLHDRRALELCRTLLDMHVDHVVVTGDVTHKGRRSELARFEEIFAPLLRDGRLTVVPGNHDRVGEDAGATLMSGARVDVRQAQGLFVVRVDSTAERNRSLFSPHGEICRRVISEVDDALSEAPAGVLRVVLLHHHPLPLPEEGIGERFCASLGWPHARELGLGRELVRVAAGRCELILHGHRHVPAELEVPVRGSNAPLRVFNGGASTQLMRFRTFHHHGQRLIGDPRWVGAGVPEPVPSAFASALQELRGVFA